MKFDRLRKYISKVDRKLLIVIGLFVVAGLITLAITKAAPQSIGAEAENGTLAKGATYVTDSSALWWQRNSVWVWQLRLRYVPETVISQNPAGTLF